MKILIAGGGASGVFAALQCRTVNGSAEIVIIEKSDRILEKVRLSGGGRCNLSHTSHDRTEFLNNYPRGRHFLRDAFFQFGPSDAISWFAGRGVATVTEPDGRIFPKSGTSQTVVECFVNALKDADVAVRYGAGLQTARCDEGSGGFSVLLTDGTKTACDRLCIATGGNRDGRDTPLFEALGHRIIQPVPSLFTLAISDPRLVNIPGVSVADVMITLPKTRFSERGALLITHRGLSGPAVLRLSAFAARYLHGLEYTASCEVNWCPAIPHRELLDRIAAFRLREARVQVVARAPVPLPQRLWQSLAHAAGCDEQQRWSDVSKQRANTLADLLHRSVFAIMGMDTNKSEFVTCGGVDLRDVEAQAMQSRIHAKLFFCGETLDIDGVTGGFNLQAAWTTGWIAGGAMGSS